MIENLAQLDQILGVRFVMLVTEDGVPVASPGLDVGDMSQEVGAHGTVEAIAAVATGWLGELEHAVAPVSWRAPRRAVMSGSRGSLILTAVRHSVLVVLAAPALDLERIKLAIDGIVARYERATPGGASVTDVNPPSALPRPRQAEETESDPNTRDAQSQSR